MLIYRTGFADANATKPTRLLRTSPATAIAKFETDTARKKIEGTIGGATAIAKATGSATGSRCIRSGEISEGVTEISGDSGL